MDFQSEFDKIFNDTKEEIRQLVVFAKASHYIYDYFPTSSELEKTKKLDGTKYDVLIEDVIKMINDGFIFRKLYENTIVRAYGVLDIYIYRLAELLITNFPTKYLKEKQVPIAQLFGDNIEKTKQGFMDESIKSYTSNKNAFNAIHDLLKTWDLNMESINEFKTKINDIYAVRNLIIHKNCIIDKKFIKDYSKKNGLNMGDILPIEYENMTYITNEINRFIFTIHKLLVEEIDRFSH